MQILLKTQCTCNKSPSSNSTRRQVGGTVFKMGSLYFQEYTLEDEQALVEYVIKYSKMFYGLHIQSTRKMSWKYARRKLKDYPDACVKNSEARTDWYCRLMKKNPKLSLRMQRPHLLQELMNSTIAKWRCSSTSMKVFTASHTDPGRNMS